ncbi:MAG: magnesium transporter [Oceanicaulis sp.]|nr:magnesium transporter [Oceanicaulis sp.]
MSALEAMAEDGLDLNDMDALIAFVADAHAVDAAALLDELEPKQARDLLMTQTLDHQTEIFGYLYGDTQEALAHILERAKLVEIVSEMNSDDRADLYNRLTEDQRAALMPGLARAEREDIRRLASHEEGTAGAIMTSDYATLGLELTAREAIESLRKEAPDKETIYRAYVVDSERKLLGSLRLQALILAAPETPIAELMERGALSVRLEEPQEEVARKIARYDVLAIPVINESGELVGIVTHDDAIDVVEAEATEDFHKFAAAGAIGESVRDAPILTLYRKRIVWLVILVFANLFSGAGIAVFEDTIAAYVTLVIFMPLIIGSGGNAGSQGATLMVRALATGDVVMKDWSVLLGRELLVAALLGVTMAVAVAPIGYARGDMDIALVVSLSMVIVVLVGSLIGMSLPFVLSRLRFDPATASAPLIATIADVMGILVYFSIATAILF